MPSTHTPLNRLEKQAPGENSDTWGARLNDNTIEMIDEALDGVVSFTLSGSKTLTEADGSTDEARQRCLNVTGGTGGTITIPDIEKLYLVRNASTGTVTITTGSGTTAVVASDETQWVVSVGGNKVYAMSGPDFATLDVAGLITGGGGILSTSPSGGVGYTAGAGGAVTQGTSKGTAVTLNKRTGTITMHAASLAAGATASFVFNNNTLGARDIMIPNVKGFNGYLVWVDGNNSSGALVVYLKNNTAGALAEAVTITYVIIPGSAT